MPSDHRITDQELIDLVTRVRGEIGDLPKIFNESFSADGAASTFELSVSPVDASSTRVYIDNVIVDEATYLVEETTGKILLGAVPSPESVVSANGYHYRYFTNDELGRICRDSFDMHVKDRSDAYGRPLTYAELGHAEHYPLVVLCNINALYVLATDASFDIDIVAPDGLTVPRGQRFSQLMGMITELKERYRELCALLGIGLYGVEVYTFRRVSKRTNRYIPVFRPQELDDRSRPQRVYTPIPSYGGEIVDDGIADMDLTINQGDTFTTVLTLDFVPAETAEFRAQIRGYPGSPVISGQFTITELPPLDSPARLELSMSASDTSNLPLRGVWDIQMKVPADTWQDAWVDDYDDVYQTLYRGHVAVPREVTKNSGVTAWDLPNVQGVTTQTSAPWQQGTVWPQSSASEYGIAP